MRNCSLENVEENAVVLCSVIEGNPYLYVECKTDLPKDTELFCDWGQMPLFNILRATVWAQASCSHSLHIYRRWELLLLCLFVFAEFCLRTLENLLDIYGIKRPVLNDLKPIQDVFQVLWLTYIQDDKEPMSMWEYEKHVDAMTNVSKDEGFPVVDRETAFVESKCKMIGRNEASSLARKQLNSIQSNDKPPK